jgi:hypothetical protein
MTQIKEKAFEMLQELPDDKVIYVIEILKGLIGLYGDAKIDTKDLAEPQMALERLKKYRGRMSANIDEKEELTKAREEKYANIN